VVEPLQSSFTPTKNNNNNKSAIESDQTIIYCEGGGSVTLKGQVGVAKESGSATLIIPVTCTYLLL
jgi:hypothetical protein